MSLLAIRWWKVRYAAIFMAACYCGPGLAWGSACAAVEMEFHEDMSPFEAVYEELSCWTNDE